MVEYYPVKVRVIGSSPMQVVKRLPVGMVDMVDLDSTAYK